MFNLKKKVLFSLAVSMVLAMVFGSFAMGEIESGMGTPASPQVVEAQSAATNDGTGDFVVDDGTASSDYSFDPNEEVLTIHGTHIISMATGATIPTGQRIFVDGTANITLSGVNIETDNGAAFEIEDNAMFSVAITLEGENTLTTTEYGCAGLQKADDGRDTGMLTITGAGTLNATGGDYAAGIGGEDNYIANCGNTSNITIDGATVESHAEYAGAGIGGGYMGNGRKINIINNSKVEAYGGANSAGIGGGQADFDDSGLVRIGGNGSEIKIIDSTVKAVGCDPAMVAESGAGAGIGGGYRGNGNKVIISNSTVIATGGSGYALDVGDDHYDYTASAAIGGGCGVFMDGEWIINPGTGSGNQIDNSSIIIAKGGADGDYPIKILQGFDEDLAGIVFEQKTDSEVNAGTVYGDTILKNDFTMPKSATLTIPQNKSLTINASKTLTVPDGSILISDGTLTINGTLSCTDTGKVETLLNYDSQGGVIKTNDDSYKIYREASGIKAYETLLEAEKNGYIFDGWYTEKYGEGIKVEETSLVLLNQHVLYANWTANPEPTSDPSIEPGHGDGSDASSKTGDSFVGIAALAILGLATTGAAMLRKRK